MNIKKGETTMGRLIEALWNCSYCGTKGNRGSIRECPNCGNPRGEDVKFYMPGQITYVSEEKAKTINRNPDWVCPYCNSLNSDSLSHCESCGSERTSENLDYFSAQKEKRARVHKETYMAKDFEKGWQADFCNDSNDDYVPEKSKKEATFATDLVESLANLVTNYGKYLISIPILLVAIWGLIALFSPKIEVVTINNFEWYRSIEIERYQTVEESDWHLPSEARLQYTQTEISGYRSVLDHYEKRSREVEKTRISGYETYTTRYRDLGNGYFEEETATRPVYETYYETEYYEEPVYRQEPIFATKYYYEIDKWLYERSVVTGEKNQSPYWGEPNLAADERVSYKSEEYYILGLNQKDKEKKISLAYTDWQNLSINQTIKVKVSIIGEGEIVEK